MIDFDPLLRNPKLMLFGAAAQFGIFFSLCMASMFFPQINAASIAIIGAEDGPASIAVANTLGSKCGYHHRCSLFLHGFGTHYSTVGDQTADQQERAADSYALRAKGRFKKIRILFPIIITVVASAIVPQTTALIGFLMFSNLIRKCGVLESLSGTAQNMLARRIV